MSWTNILKVEFEFNPGGARGSSSPVGSPRTVVNLSSFENSWSDEKLIPELIGSIIHESTHEGIDDAAHEEYYEKPIRDLMRQISDVYRGAVLELLGKSADFFDLDKIHANIVRLVEYNMIGEMYASYSGGQEATSRILAERYAMKTREKLVTLLKAVLDDTTEILNPTLLEANPKLNNRNKLRLTSALKKAEEHTLQIIDKIGEFYVLKADNFILKLLHAEQASGKEQGFYKSLLLKVIRSPNGWDTLQEYLDTGNMDIMERFLPL